jgi:cyanophycinase
LDKRQLIDWHKSLFGINDITLLHNRNREVSNSTQFISPLKTANGIYIDGGRQWRLVDAYLGTGVVTEIKNALNRGAVVMGSSAGATIIGSFLIRGMPANSDYPEGDNRGIIYPGYTTGFGLLPNSAIDQHVDERGRNNDLRTVIDAHPKLTGLGLFQDAAIVVHQNKFYVIDGQVIVWSKSKNGAITNIELRQRQGYDLSTRSALN